MRWAVDAILHTSNLIEFEFEVWNQTFTSVAIKTVTQPGVGRGEQRMKDDDFWNRIEGVRTFYVDEEVDVRALRHSTSADGVEMAAFADEITLGTDRYRVLNVDVWDNHKRVIAEKI